MGAQHVHPAVKGGRGVVLPDDLHGLPEVLRAAAPEVVQGADPEGVVHQAVGLPPQQVAPPLVIGDLVAAVLPDLPQQEARRLLLHHHPPDAGDELVGQLVRHVQPPGVRPGAQPAADDRVRPLNDEINVIRVHLVDGGQGVDAPPAVIAHRPLLKAVPGDVGALVTLRRAEGGVGPAGVEIAAVAAGVVEHSVQHHVDAPLPGLPAQAAEILLRAQHGVHLVVVPGVVAVVAVRLKDGAEVEGGNPQALQIVQLLLNSGQTAAEEVPVADLPPLVRQVLHQLLPVPVDHPVPQHPPGIGHPGAAEAVGEDLVGHAPAEPVRRGEGVVVDRLLPADRLPLAAQSVFPQPDHLPAVPGKAEAEPDQIRLLRQIADPGKEGPVLLLPRGIEGDLPAAGGELGQSHQRTGGKALGLGRPEREKNPGGTGECAIGVLAAGIAGIKNRHTHRQFSPGVSFKVHLRQWNSIIYNFLIISSVSWRKLRIFYRFTV